MTITQFVYTVAKKSVVYFVFQNTATPHDGLLSLEEMLGVSRAEHAVVLLSVNWSISFAFNRVKKFPEEKAHHNFLTVVSLYKNNNMNLSIS